MLPLVCRVRGVRPMKVCFRKSFLQHRVDRSRHVDRRHPTIPCSTCIHQTSVATRPLHRKQVRMIVDRFRTICFPTTPFCQSPPVHWNQSSSHVIRSYMVQLPTGKTNFLEKNEKNQHVNKPLIPKGSILPDNFILLRPNQPAHCNHSSSHVIRNYMVNLVTEDQINCSAHNSRKSGY